jgi:hypothetical protein
MTSYTPNHQRKKNSMFGRNNSNNLARRDPAAAALLGAIGSNFGVERRPVQRAQPRSRFGVDFGADVQFGSDAWNNNFGTDVVPAPTPQAMQQAWNNQVQQQLANRKREQLLEPNKGVEAKVERYAMPTSQAITIGTALNNFVITANPTVNLRPSRVVSNAPSPAFVFLLSMSVANVNVLVGPGVQDAWDYAAEAVGTSLDIPTLSPSNPIRITGNYTGFVPGAYVATTASFFTMTFIGWASITG